MLLAPLAFACNSHLDDGGVDVPWRQAPAHWPLLPEPADNSLNVARWELGKRLFFDPNLSIDGTVSCASCHEPSLAFGSDTPTSFGAGGASGTRNAPALVNVGYFPYYLREGGVPTLEMQVLVPIQEENEFHHNIVVIADSMKNDEWYASMSLEAYNEMPSPFVVTRALAAFQRGLIDGNSPYDRWVNGDLNALDSAALAGMDVYHNAGCERCHSGFLFTDHRILNTGLHPDYEDEGLARLTGLASDVGKFKVPSLRNVGVTAPYMFDGSLETLDDVLDHYTSGGYPHPNKAPEMTAVALTEAERENLKAFLLSLTDPSFLAWAKDLNR